MSMIRDPLKLIAVSAGSPAMRPESFPSLRGTGPLVGQHERIRGAARKCICRRWTIQEVSWTRSGPCCC